MRANRLDPDNALPLQSYFQSFAIEGRPPTKIAIAGLMRAQELAPQDGDLRFNAMAQSIRDGDLDRARALLRPLAYNPHGGADNPAARLLTALEGVKDKATAEAALESSMKPAAAPAGGKPGAAKPDAPS